MLNCIGNGLLDCPQALPSQLFKFLDEHLKCDTEKLGRAWGQANGVHYRSLLCCPHLN